MKHLLAIVFLIPLSLSAEISKLEYHGFTLWFDCKAKVAIQFQYTLDRDVGAIRRIHKYYHDPILAPYCQQFGTLSYKPWLHFDHFFSDEICHNVNIQLG